MNPKSQTLNPTPCGGLHDALAPPTEAEDLWSLRQPCVQLQAVPEGAASECHFITSTDAAPSLGSYLRTHQFRV